MPACRPDHAAGFARPILMFGLPRSGTSWVGKILDSHPLTLFRHEPDSELRCAGLPLLPELTDDRREADRIADYLDRLLLVRSEKVNGSYPFFRKDYHASPAFMARTLLAMLSKAGGRLGWRLDIPDLIAPGERDRVRIVWKSIESTGRLGLFARLLDDCRAVHLLRHPCGQIASMLRGIEDHKFTSATPVFEDEGIFTQLAVSEAARRRNLTFDALWRASPVEKLAWYWVLINEKALADCAGLAKVMPLLYEDLCQRPLEASKQMFRHVGLDWSPQSEQFLRQSTGEDKAGYYSVYKNSVQSAGRWREKMAQGDVTRIEAIVKDSPPLWAFYGDSFRDAPEDG